MLTAMHCKFELQMDAETLLRKNIIFSVIKASRDSAACVNIEYVCAHAVRALPLAPVLRSFFTLSTDIQMLHKAMNYPRVFWLAKRLW
jgi:hypothetical protein